jgi:hypothetical protein
MPSARRIIAPMFLAVACTAGHLSAQDNQDAIWRPVDQTVADLDLRATSLRRVEPGVGVFGQSGALYNRGDPSFGYDGRGLPLSQQYQLRQPGYTAWLDRPDYLVVDLRGTLNRNVAASTDGHYLNMVPPNTVFDLVPRGDVPVVPYMDPYDDGWGLDRVNTRITGEIGGEVTGDPSVRPLIAPPRAHRLPEHLMARRKAHADAEAEQADQTQASQAQEEEPVATEPVESDSGDTSEP